MPENLNNSPIAGAPNALKSDPKKPRICPIWGKSDPLWSQTYHPYSYTTFPLLFFPLAT